MQQFGFLALALRQRLIKRWSLMHSSQPESVLEHSAVVTILTLLVGNLAIQAGREVNLGTMLAHAILHDAPEVLTSDVVTPVKKANKVLETEFRRLEDAAEKQLVSTLPDELKAVVLDAFKPPAIEAQLVKACDTYAAFIKCKIEVAAGNKQEFGDALTQISKLVDELKEQVPEIKLIDDWFGGSFNLSVDRLLNPEQ